MLGLIIAMFWWLSAPLWAESESPPGATAAGRQYQSVTEELMAMLKETMSIIRNLDHAPSADEKRHLAEMINRLDAMLKQQQQAMQDMRDQLDSIRQQQNEFFQRQHTLEQQQSLPQR
jgi:DNA gyrase/topoisomerase IV subunit A